MLPASARTSARANALARGRHQAPPANTGSFGGNVTIVDMLRKNAELYPNEVALVEVNPQRHENRHITWREYELV